MKQLILITVALLALAASTAAQTRGYVAGSVGVTANLGFANPSVGGGAGGNYRTGKFGVTGELLVERVKKNVGGSGFQVSGRETAQLFHRNLFVQAGAVEQHYSVAAFSKSAFEPLVGVGYATANSVIEANFRADVASPNAARIIEGRYTAFLSHHIFVRGSIAVDNFKAGRSRQTGVGTRIEVGLWR